MKTDNVLYWVIYFVVTVIIAWIALSLILMWFGPALYDANGNVNWWVTLWVAALIIFFAWIITLILAFIIKLFAGNFGCAKPVECEPKPSECPPKPKPNPCNPCDVKGGTTSAFNPGVWVN